MSFIYIALDPISGAPVAKGQTFEEVAEQIASQSVRAEFAALPTPVYHCELVGKKARNGVKVGEVAV